MRLSFFSIGAVFFVCGAVGACTFGVNLDGVFGADAAAPNEAGADVVEAALPPVPAVQISAGYGFSCARRADGTVSCWGYEGDEGRLGDNAIDPKSAPVLVAGVSDAVDVSVGRSHACAVRKSGSLVCWGYNGQRQLGDGTSMPSKIPIPVSQIDDAIQVASGGSHTCALSRSGTVSCWGDNTMGQLGDGTTASRGQPAQVPNLSGVTQVVATAVSTCALLKSGDVYCWGHNAEGEIGKGDQGPDVLQPTKVVMPLGATSLGASGSASHVCAITPSDLRCWGSSTYGALGGNGPSGTPVVVAAISNVTSVSTGDNFTCASRKSGAVECWGFGAWRQIGGGDTAPPDAVSSPIVVDSVSDAAVVAAGGNHACALEDTPTQKGQIVCWGSNADGRLGRGTRVYATTPVKTVAPPLSQIRLSNDFACAVSAKGEALCWGEDHSGVLGRDSPAALSTPAIATGLAANVSAVAVGTNQSCAIVSGQAQCWGYNYDGELGSGNNTSTSKAVPFLAPSAVSDIGAGYGYTCALLQSQGIVCSGLGNDNRLGQMLANAFTPVAVMSSGMPLGGASKLAVGGNHVLALVGNQLYTWGYAGYGECGTKGGAVVGPASLAQPVIDMCAGDTHSCVIFQDGTVGCFGRGDSGQLGGGTGGTDVIKPNLAKKTTALACGVTHTCALLEDATVWCWGGNRFGQLGNGTRSDSSNPSMVQGLASVRSIAAGDSISCAITMDGGSYCWGNNSLGQLGDGTIVLTGVADHVVGY